jgi:hypothetical protein
MSRNLGGSPRPSPPAGNLKTATARLSHLMAHVAFGTWDKGGKWLLAIAQTLVIIEP